MGDGDGDVDGGGFDEDGGGGDDDGYFFAVTTLLSFPVRRIATAVKCKLKRRTSKARRIYKMMMMMVMRLTMVVLKVARKRIMTVRKMMV